jgi:hypothetical protein
METLSGMGLLSSPERVVARVLNEMSRQRLSCSRLADRAGYPPDYLAMRLGLLVPGGGCRGKVPLVTEEIGRLAGALRVPAEQLAG